MSLWKMHLNVRYGRNTFAVDSKGIVGWTEVKPREYVIWKSRDYSRL